MTLTLISEEGTYTAKWKQDSVLGMGGNRTQSYLKCVYELDNKDRLPVFVQVRRGGVG